MEDVLTRRLRSRRRQIWIFFVCRREDFVAVKHWKCFYWHGRKFKWLNLFVPAGWHETVISNEVGWLQRRDILMTLLIRHCYKSRFIVSFRRKNGSNIFFFFVTCINNKLEKSMKGIRKDLFKIIELISGVDNLIADSLSRLYSNVSGCLNEAFSPEDIFMAVSMVHSIKAGDSSWIMRWQNL